MDFSRPLQTVTPTLDGDVLAVLARVEEDLSGRQVHRLVGHSSEHGVRKALDRLAGQGIVQSRRAGQARLYRLNREHLAAPYVERLAFLTDELVTRLREATAHWEIKPVAALLFGSVAQGRARPQSDLDLLVVRPTGCDEDAPVWRDQVAELQRSATAWTGNDARVLEYGEEELEQGLGRREPVLAGALRDGTVIAGSRRLLHGWLEGTP